MLIQESLQPTRTAPPAAQGSAGRPSMHVLVRALAALDEADRAADAGERARALDCYGRALNDYLREGLPVIAAHIAQRMIRRFPDVVRARMTLAVLSLAEGLRVLSPRVIRSSRADFEQYVEAARTAGQEEMAIRQLHRFAGATESADVREHVAEFLHALGDSAGAERVFIAAYEEREGIRSSRRFPGDQRDRWIDLLIAS